MAVPRRPKIPELPRAKRGIAAASAAGFCARTRPPGTEFLDSETGPQISPPKWVSAHRDKNPGNEWSEIPAETPYLALCRKRVVCKDWMVVHAVICEPVSHPAVALLTGQLTGDFASSEAPEHIFCDKPLCRGVFSANNPSNNRQEIAQ